MSGSMRYGNVFGEAIRLVAADRIAPSSLVTGVLPLADVPAAMQLAAAKENALKAQLLVD